MATNNFFDSLKAKSEAMSKSRAAEKLTETSSGKIVDNIVSGKRRDDGIGDKPKNGHLYSLSEIASGKSWSEAEVTAPEVLAEAGAAGHVDGQAVRIEHVLSSDPVLFRLYFPAKPSQLIRRDLLDAGFKWEPDGFFWYGTDTPEHRAFLKRIFSFSAGDAASLETAAAEAEAVEWLNVGDRVSWRGVWGLEDPPVVTVSRISVDEPGGDGKYGDDKGRVPWARCCDRSVVVHFVENSHWAYGNKLTRLTVDGVRALNLASELSELEAVTVALLAEERAEKRPELPEIRPIPMAPGVAAELQAFEVYKQQCQELCAHLSVDPADLALVAVGYLHKSVFSQQ